MKKEFSIGLIGLAIGAMMFLAGCSTEIVADYVMPAKAVTDVKAVDVVKIEATADVKGSLAGDAGANAGLLKQLLAMRLCKEGYYRIVDNISGDKDGAAALTEWVRSRDAGHGYSALTASTDEKAVIKLALDMTLDVRPVTTNKEFRLCTTTYKEDKDGKLKPTVVPQPPVLKQLKYWETVASGHLVATMICKKESKKVYEGTFEITIPDADRFEAAKPSQLKAFAAAVSPAIEGIVADISPKREERKLVIVEKGDYRVECLLKNKAFAEIEMVVNELRYNGQVNYSDFTNLGIAREATGDFAGAKLAYKEAIAANPDSEEAKAGLKRVEDVLAGNKVIKASNAKQNADTKFDADK